MSNHSEGRLLLTQADGIESRLQKLAQSGFLYELGRQAADLIDSEDLASAWSLLTPFADYSLKQEAYGIFRSIIEWSRRAESYSRRKWGTTSTGYQSFRKSCQRVLRLFEKTRTPPSQIAAGFAILVSELRELVDANPPPAWKKVLTFVPDVIRILAIVLRA